MKPLLPFITTTFLLVVFSSGCASSPLFSKKNDAEKFSTAHLLEMAQAFEAQGDHERAKKLYETIELRNPNRAYLTESEKSLAQADMMESVSFEEMAEEVVPADAVKLEFAPEQSINQIQTVAYEEPIEEFNENQIPETKSVKLITVQHEKELIDELQAFEGNTTYQQETSDLAQFSEAMNDEDFWSVPESDSKQLVMKLPGVAEEPEPFQNSVEENVATSDFELLDLDAEESLPAEEFPVNEYEVASPSEPAPFAPEPEVAELDPLQEEVVFFPGYTEEEFDEVVLELDSAPAPEMVIREEPAQLPNINSTTAFNEEPAPVSAMPVAQVSQPVSNDQGELSEFKPSRHALNQMKLQKQMQPESQAVRTVATQSHDELKFELPIIKAKPRR